MKNLQQSRNGFNKVELLVVAFTLVVLLALIVPAMREARGPVIRTQCLNNQRNVGLAILSFASNNRGHLPNQAFYPSAASSDGRSWETFEGRSWVVELMPYLDRGDEYDRWQKDKPWDNSLQADSHGVSNSSIAKTYLEHLVCPNDESAFQVEGGLSYVLNCGIGDLNWHTATGTREVGHVESGHHYMVEPFDWNGNGVLPPEDLEDALITSDFTLFWPEFTPPEDSESKPEFRKTHNISEIYDGYGNTIMLGENIKAGSRSDANKSSWADPQVFSNGLVLPIDAKRLSPTSHASDGSLASLVISQPINPAINASRYAEEGTAPFLNSNHPGIVVVSFCDGSVKTLSETIDMQVYVRLLTPRGTIHRDINEFVPEEPLSAENF